MANRDLADEKILCRKAYVEEGMTTFTDLEQRFGVSLKTIRKWAKDDAWSSQREQIMVSIPQIAKRMARLLSLQVAAIEEKQANGEPVSELEYKRMLSYAESINKLDQRYDSKGNMILFCEELISYVSALTGERTLARDLRRIMPGFFSFIEGKAKKNR